VIVYAETVPGAGRFTLTPVDPAAHAEMLHDWVTREHTRFWGMSTYTVAEVRDVYAFLESLSTHHAYLMRLDDEPVGIFQTYEPEHDPVGERYAVRPGDFGVHILFARRGLAEKLTPALARYAFADPAHRRIVVEPDVRNGAALLRMRMAGFEMADEIDMPDKRAQLAFLTRERFEAAYAAA
jgi:penicillin amidase